MTTHDPHRQMLCRLAFTLLPLAATAALVAQRATPTPPQGHVRMTSTKVTTTIVDGVATNELQQILHNDGPQDAEAVWILPLPADAAADRFTMTVAGKEMESEVLDAGRARSIYEEIVRRRRDPGLLEYIGGGMLRARIFPIPPKQAITVLVRYRQVLPETGGLFQWRFPLRAAGVDGLAAEHVAVDVTIRSKTPLKNVFSPLQGVDVVRKGDHEARLSLERKGGVADADLTAFYGLSEKDFGLHLLTFAEPGQPGTFLMLLAPKHDWADTKPTPRQVTFVVDTSGSMLDGNRIAQARAALKFFVGSLKPHDRFDIVTFATEARSFFGGPVVASREQIEEAQRKIDAIEARGGTNIDEALRQALLPRTEGAVPIVVFLTDGLPTVGTTDVDTILANARKAAGDARVFVFGVGNDVHTRLLDGLADATRGDRDYVREGESIEVKTSALFDKLSHPVLTDVSLTVDGLEVLDVSPARLPDLFKGSRLTVVGRYRGDGHKAIRLKGTMAGTQTEFVFEGSFPTEAREHGFVPTIWATRRIATLLEAIRRNGQQKELMDELTRLSTTHGIVTPYTSHLIVEEGARLGAIGPSDGRGWGDRSRPTPGGGGAAGPAGPGMPGPTGPSTPGPRSAPAEESRRELNDLERAKDSGGKAVDTSVYLSRLATGAADDAYGTSKSLAGVASRRVEGRTFFDLGGIWIDGALKPAMKDRIRKVTAFTPEYFELLKQHPQLTKVFALGTRVVVVVGDSAIEVVADA
jgi:Ca-activated chloride channel family protein